jgi:hypothetical protein
MQLVAIPKFETIHRCRSEIVVTSNLCKTNELTAIPFPLSFSRLSIQIGDIDKVETIASGTNRSAIAATQAPFAQLIP